MKKIDALNRVSGDAISISLLNSHTDLWLLILMNKSLLIVRMLRMRLVRKRTFRKKICNRLTKNKQNHRIIYKISLICRSKRDFIILTKSSQPAKTCSQPQESKGIRISARQTRVRASNPWLAARTPTGCSERRRFTRSSNHSKCRVSPH